jgi:hypothetical protein
MTIIGPRDSHVIHVRPIKSFLEFFTLKFGEEKSFPLWGEYKLRDGVEAETRGRESPEAT